MGSTTGTEGEGATIGVPTLGGAATGGVLGMGATLEQAVKVRESNKKPHEVFIGLSVQFEGTKKICLRGKVKESGHLIDVTSGRTGLTSRFLGLSVRRMTNEKRPR